MPTPQPPAHPADPRHQTRRQALRRASRPPGSTHPTPGKRTTTTHPTTRTRLRQLPALSATALATAAIIAASTQTGAGAAEASVTGARPVTIAAAAMAAGTGAQASITVIAGHPGRHLPDPGTAGRSSPLRGVRTADTRTSPRFTKADWQHAIARLGAPGRGCYRASYPMLQWHASRCVTAARIPLAPAPLPRPARQAGPATVGNGTDYSAQVPGLISQATGTFHNVSPSVTEQGYVGGAGPLTTNAFSLQLNSQFFAGSPACHASGNPSGCQAWQQFVYTYEGCSGGVSCIFMQYWLINYDASCPSGWFTYGQDCYTNSNAAAVSGLSASQLATVALSGSAASGGNDGVSLSVGSGQATSVTNSDSKVDLAAHWNTTEWGVYGDAGGSEAYFGANTTLEAQTTLATNTMLPPTCLPEGFTGETNNLNLTSTPPASEHHQP